MNGKTSVPADFDILMGSVPQKGSSQPYTATNGSNGQSSDMFGFGSGTSGTEYTVTFRVQYKTDLGQSLCMVGSLEELGRWKNYKGHMKWTEGHFWVITLKVSQPVFQYKYVVLEDNTSVLRWEQGFNRIADLPLLSSQQAQSTTLDMNDIFDRYTVNFSIYFPVKQCEYMRINGDPEELGIWNKMDGPLPMKLSKTDVVWLTGEKVRPWVFPVTFKQGVCPKYIKYKYSVHNPEENINVWEREPSRVLDLQDPNNYHGDLGNAGSDMWRNVEKAFVVNGHVEKADANFVGGLTFEEIGNTKVWIGPYPQIEADTQTMKDSGITGILNVQTDIDINHRGINWPKMLEYYEKRGMTAIHYPIHDFNEAHLTERLFGAAEVLNDMINNKGLTVYVHCTAGMGRAPASVLVYYILYKKISMWNDTHAVDRYVKSHRPVVTPNLRAITNVINTHRDFQNKQKEDFQD